MFIEGSAGVDGRIIVNVGRMDVIMACDGGTLFRNGDTEVGLDIPFDLVNEWISNEGPGLWSHDRECASGEVKVSEQGRYPTAWFIDEKNSPVSDVE